MTLVGVMYIRVYTVSSQSPDTQNAEPVPYDGQSSDSDVIVLSSPPRKAQKSRKRRRRAAQVMEWWDEEEPECQPVICRFKGMDLDPMHEKEESGLDHDLERATPGFASALESATFTIVSLYPKLYIPDLYLTLSKDSIVQKQPGFSFGYTQSTLYLDLWNYMT
ncbi:hypothetical protein AC249_AIPGENE13312 [Exaiptasia diaphana]|nr:hypothetical protein AC249_AIPGENE13312 [Exaiptasia diaphana]